jgi:predicted RNase H-like nuclease (RuvC/YqgF family)
MADEFADLLDQIRALSTQLASIITKTEFLARDIAALCDDRRRLQECADRLERELAEVKKQIAVIETAGSPAAMHAGVNIADLQKEVALLKLKADYAANVCESLGKSVSTLQEINWKLVGAVTAIAAIVSLATPWLVRLVFG